MNVAEREVKQIVRPFHHYDSIPDFSTADLLMPKLCHVSFVPRANKEPKEDPKGRFSYMPRAKTIESNRLRKERIAKLLSEGKDIPEIAKEFGLCVKTIRNSIHNYRFKIPGKKAETMAILKANGDEIAEYCKIHGAYRTAKSYKIHYLTIKAFMERRA